MKKFKNQWVLFLEFMSMIDFGNTNVGACSQNKTHKSCAHFLCVYVFFRLSHKKEIRSINRNASLRVAIEFPNLFFQFHSKRYSRINFLTAINLNVSPWQDCKQKCVEYIRRTKYSCSLKINLIKRLLYETFGFNDRFENRKIRFTFYCSTKHSVLKVTYIYMYEFLLSETEWGEFTQKSALCFLWAFHAMSHSLSVSEQSYRQPYFMCCFPLQMATRRIYILVPSCCLYRYRVPSI